MPVEGFRNPVATDGSLLGVSDRWGASVWSVVQLDHDEDVGPMHGMYGTLDPGLEVQRTIERAELTAFIRHFRRKVDPTTDHFDNKGIIDGLWRGEMKCIGPKAKDADLWLCIWEEVRRIHQEGVLLEVEHVKAHRSKKDVQEIKLFEQFATEGHDRAEELTKDGAMLDEAKWLRKMASTLQQRREEVLAASHCSVSFPCLVVECSDCEELKLQPKEKWIVVDKKERPRNIAPSGVQPRADTVA